jgi:hypothetical protein
VPEPLYVVVEYVTIGHDLEDGDGWMSVTTSEDAVHIGIGSTANEAQKDLVRVMEAAGIYVTLARECPDSQRAALIVESAKAMLRRAKEEGYEIV